MLDVLEKYGDLISLLKKDGGFTISINPDGRVPRTGYMVSINGFEECIPLDKFNFYSIVDYVKNNEVSLTAPNRFLGAWIQDNTVYLDVSVAIDDLDRACYTGICNHQKAIYDLKNQVEIKLPSPQISGTLTQNNDYNWMTAKKIAHGYLFNDKL